MEDPKKSFIRLPAFKREDYAKEKLPKNNPDGTRKPASALYMMTMGLFETYKNCDPEMKTFMFYKPKRYITNPSEGLHNHGLDNEEYDLILAANDELENKKSGRVYVAKEVLGKGTFGQVVHVKEKVSGKEFAAKIIKSKKNYAQFVLNYEVKILSVLNRFEKKLKAGKVQLKGIDIKKQSRIISLYEKFMYKKHMVLIMEKLDMSIFDLLKIANFQGFTLNVIRKFGRHILEGLCVLKKNKIVHCDLKPENILLINKSSHKLKIIDLGSACSEKLFPFTYIQSRYYRAPEVILGLPFTSAIDMWSFACILLELYLGIPIFPGSSLYDMVYKVIKFTGMPHDDLIERAKHGATYFVEEDGEYRLKTVEEYETDEKSKINPIKTYHHFSGAKDLPKAYRKSKLRENPTVSDERKAKVFADLTSKILVFDANQRLTPLEALKHPFFDNIGTDGKIDEEDSQDEEGHHKKKRRH